MDLREITGLLLPFVEVFVSWPVVVLVFLLAFRKQLVQLLDDLGKRLTKAKFGEHSVEFSPVTTETDVGKTNVSAVATEFETDSQVFRSRSFGFEISYPANGQWLLDSDPQGQGAEIPGQTMVLLVRYHQLLGGFNPNVNVVIQPTGDMTIKQYMANTLASFGMIEGKMDSFAIDSETQGALLSYDGSFPVENPETGGQEQVHTRHVARIILANGFGYLATSTLLAGSNPPDDFLAQMNAIINSFQVTRR